MKFENKVERLRIEKYKGRETAEFLNDVKKMAGGEAFEYLMGEVDFCEAKINLSLRPMIPRPETEFWMKEAIKEIVDSRQETTEKQENVPVFRALDLFAGSGCLGLAVLKNFPNSQVDFIELVPELKEQIEISVKKNKIEENRARVFTGDVFNFPSRQGLGGKYDYIFAVPPYVPSQMKDEVMKELHNESEVFFFDKEDGFFYIKKVLDELRNYLNEGGVMYMEFDMTQRLEIEELIIKNGFKNYSFLKDPYGHECCVLVTVNEKLRDFLTK